MRDPDCGNLWKNMSKDVQSVKRPKQTSINERPHYNILTSLPIHINGSYHGPPQIQWVWLDPHHHTVDQGCSKVAKFIPSQNNWQTRCHQWVSEILCALVQNTQASHIQPRPTLCIHIFKSPMCQPRCPTEFVHGISLKNRWTDRKDECLGWAVFASMDSQMTE